MLADDMSEYEAGTLYCTVLTLTRRMALNIDSQFGGLRVLMYASMTRKVKTIDMIQYVVDIANMIVVIASSHFRDRVRSPLALFHHEASLSESRYQAKLDKGSLTR
jgi:hypothetical protein